MRLVLDSDTTVQIVRRYQPGEVVVGEQRLTAPCILSARRVISDWKADPSTPPRDAELAPLLELAPAIVLLGWAHEPQIPEPTVRRGLADRGIALECMSLGAACRTYNILVQEGRPVVAGLFP
jgi:uncharacterized protein